MILKLLCVLARVLIIPFCRLTVDDRPDVKSLGPVVLVANHRSLFDVLVGMTAFRWRGVYPRVLIASDWMPGPLLWLGRHSGVIPVDRRNGRSSADVAADAIRAGATLMIMPEGKLYWNPDDPLEFGPIRPGLARIAHAAGVPAVPVAVQGTQHVWPHGSVPRPRLWNRPLVTVTIGEPVVIDDSDPHVQAEAVMQRVREMLAA